MPQGVTLIVHYKLAFKRRDIVEQGKCVQGPSRDAFVAVGFEMMVVGDKA